MRVEHRYTIVAITLHWLIAALIIANIALIWSVDALPQGWARPVIDTHKSFGLTVLGLAILRLLWRLGNPPPPLPPSYPRWERLAAHSAHWLLYALIFAMPLSGWLHDSAWKAAAEHPLFLYGFIPFFRIGLIEGLDPATKEMLHGAFGATHALLADGLYVLLALHVGAALKHQFFDREPELQRMLPGGGGA